MSSAQRKKTKNPIKWTLEACKADALQYPARKRWEQGSCGYQTAWRNGWLEECCGHMSTPVGTMGRPMMWTREACLAEALKFKTRSEFQYESGGAYQRALKEKWLDECCAHM